MAEILSIFLVVSGILFFGFVAEFIFKKLHVPDLLLLVIFGFLLGPHVLNYITPGDIISFAPLFTTFALLFLLFDSAFDIDLASFAKGIIGGLSLSIFNFMVSFLVIGIIAYAFGFSIIISALLGLILGGISSSFVVPIIKKIKMTGEGSASLIFESAITDVFSIVLAITLMELIRLNNFSFQIVFGKIASLFAVAGFVGIIAGIIWIIFVTKIIKEEKPYTITIAYLLLVYVATEFLQGNGAISALFLGLVLKNSRLLEEIFIRVTTRRQVTKKKKEEIIPATSKREESFHHQISFFIKAFFFVYVGMLFDITDTRVLIIAGVIAIAILIARNFSWIIIKGYEVFDRSIIRSVFARGLASAVVSQLTIQYAIPDAGAIIKIVYSVIVFTIFLSSIRIFGAIEKDKENIHNPNAPKVPSPG